MPRTRRLVSLLRRLPLLVGVGAVLAGGALLVFRLYPVEVGLSVLGLGVVSLSLAHWWERRRAFTGWIPFLLGAAVLLAGLVVWQNLRTQEDLSLERRVDLAARGIRNDAQNRLGAVTASVARLADPGEQAAPRSLQDLRRAIERAFESHPALLAVEWIEADAEIQVLGTPAGAPEGVSRPRGPRVELLRQAMERVTETGRPEVVGPFTTASGRTAFRVLVPVAAADGRRVALAGLVSAGETFAGLRDLVEPRYAFRVVAGDTEVYAMGELSPELPLHRLPLEIPGELEWRVEVAATPELVAEESSGLAEIALAVSVVLAVLLTLTTWFGERAARRARRFETAVAQRTAELEAAKAEAQAANASKDHFLAMLGHELRNPLASISTALEVLRRQSVQDPIREDRMRGIVQRQMQHMARLVDDLLDVSRIERGKLPLRMERLDLARLVRDVAETERARIEEARIEFSVDVPPGPLWIDGDVTRLTQVVYNLLSNAAKFTEPGGSIRVLAAADPTAESASVAVRDTGVGIDPAELERIFEPFAQTADGIQRASGGLGLGLPIVKGLVEAHGGEIRATSSGRGRGTEIAFRLPLREAPAEEAAPRPREERAGGERVLVIDDHRDSREGLRELLLIFGHEVEVARDGDEGLRAAEAAPFDTVICDIGLPGDLDGYAVAEALRGAPETASLHLVALTGYGDEETVRRALEAGFDRHLTKPVDPQLLREVVAEAGRPDDA